MPALREWIDEDLVRRSLRTRPPSAPKLTEKPNKLLMSDSDFWQIARELWRQNHPEFVPPFSPAALRNDIEELLEFKAGIGECPPWYRERATELGYKEPEFPKEEVELDEDDEDW